MKGVDRLNVHNKLNHLTLPSTNGNITLPAEGKWTVLHIYEGDFSPVSETELLALNKAYPKFKAHGAQIIALSRDSVAAHVAWTMALKNRTPDAKPIEITLVSDRSGKLICPLGLADGLTSGTIITDPDGVIRSFDRQCAKTGINVTETERKLIALQTAFAQEGLTPASWTPGEDILETPPQTTADALLRLSQKHKTDGTCLDWYICYKPDSAKRSL